MNLELVENFYDHHENANVRFVGFSTNDVRYDFGIIYTTLFFGKPLVVCMQTGRSALMDASDAEDLDFIQRRFKIKQREEANDLATFLQEAIPFSTLEEQYE